MLTGLLQPTHLMLLLAVVLLVLGPKRLPEAGRAMGRSFREFKDSIHGDDAEIALSRTEPHEDNAKRVSTAAEANRPKQPR